MHLRLVANSLKPMHVQVKVKVARNDWYFLEDLQGFNWQRLK